MKLYSLITALVAIGACALQASAQVTLVSQSRSVAASGCAGSQFFSAPDFNPFNTQAFINCGEGVGMGQSVQNSTVATNLINLAHQAQGGGVTNTSSNFVVVFDVTEPVSYTFVASSDNATAQVKFSGPSVNFNFTNSSVEDSGALQPGRYTVTSTATNPAPPAFAKAAINLGFTTDSVSIPWATIDGGGGSLSGGSFTIVGTIGQPDATAGPALAGGSFTIAGGLWNSAVVPCTGDVDGDGEVDSVDLAIMLGAWGPTDSSADLDGDGQVGPIDVAVLLGAWGSCPG